MTDLTAVSLFAGIGGIDLALKMAGVRVVAAVEIDRECRGVLRRHFPDVVLFEDVREVTGDQLRAAGFVPGRGILAGGSPCQDFSVAGRRAGLSGARSGLFRHILRLADELHPRWLLFENVPGLLSAVCSCPGNETCLGNGRAVRCGRWEKQRGKRVFLDHVTHTPQGGACAGGCMGRHGGAMGTVLGALGKRWDGLAYRVLDAQHFGVPQRRRRVFVVGCTGDRAAPVEVLLDPEGSPGDPAAGGTPGADAAGSTSGGAGVAGTVGTLAGTGPGGGWRLGPDEAAAGQLIAGTLGSREGGSRTTDLDGHGAYIAATIQGGGRRGHRIDAEGAAGGHLIPLDLAQVTSGENRSNPQPGDPAGTLAATSRPAVAYALRADHGAGNAHNVSYAITARNDRNDREDNYVLAATLTAGAHGQGVSDPGRRSEDDVNIVAGPMAFNPQTGGSKARIGYGDKPTALSCTQSTGVTAGAAVRRLTPLERERLQGLPDEWTRWRLGEDGRQVEQSDAARDRQTGNSVAVPVLQWIAARLVAADLARAPEAPAEPEAGAA